MPDKKPKQTLLPKENEKQWFEVLHGESPAVDDNDTQVNALKIRNYLIARDEAIAADIAVDSGGLDTISAEEARVIYRQAKDESRRRQRVRFFKTYGLGALIGALCATVATVFVVETVKPPISPALPNLPVDASLNFSDYPALKFNEEIGPFPNMLLIPGGVTSIGCAKGWDDVSGGCRPSEFPSHAVTIDTFEISQHEVTYAQFRQFIESSGYVTDAEKNNRGCVHEDMDAPGTPFVMNPKLTWKTPGYEQTDGHPVTCVSWHDAQQYVAWLSAETKTPYRLPTEVEWERAARGGQATAYFWGSKASNNQANYSGVGGKDQWPTVAPVGQFPANKYYVQDTSGNLWEWVEDCWHTTYHNAPTDGKAWEAGCENPSVRVRRGGSWDMNGAGMRSAIRSPGSQHDRSNLYGFRVARDWQKKQ